MRINKLKNCIGLCACEGCRQPLKVLIEIKSKASDGRLINKRKFWLCYEHSWNFEEDL